jgi:hypothetical protein
MSTAAQPLFDMSKATPIQAPLFDMSQAKPISEGAPTGTDPLRGAAEATGLSADTRGPFRKAWDEIKRGLTSAQYGEGLKPQPTTLANAAQFVGMGADTLSKLGWAPEAAIGASAVNPSYLGITGKAEQGFKELAGALNSHSVEMTDRLANAAADIKDAADTGSTLPSVVNKFMTRISEEGGGPISYKEARQFYHNVSELSASERMAARPSDLRLLNEFKNALGEAIGSTADAAGRLEQYQQTMKDFARAKGVQEAAKTAVKYLAPAIGGGGALYQGWRMLKDMSGNR